ncbi:hypothetical protein Egran_02686 [Elaphomyces granulatus]|uniref:Uncharacterized protein n=1 Tax=Elaphomyces granulatus TaxID=519963 RepID=A0A232LZE6_9EURO|nr:hypothetical protein Egran_02686 [Elaphomyces granulatus]
MFDHVVPVRARVDKSKGQRPRRRKPLDQTADDMLHNHVGLPERKWQGKMSEISNAKGQEKAN